MTLKGALIFRVEAGCEVGLGHLRRSLSLAQALRQRGVESSFLVNREPAAAALLEQEGFPAEPISAAPPYGKEDASCLLGAIRRRRAAGALLDSPYVTATYVGHLRKLGVWLAVRDDLCTEPYPVHMVLNANADAWELPYAGNGGGVPSAPSRREDPLLLLGPRYAVLAPEFWRPPPRELREEVREVLVLFGGGDPHGGLPRVIEMLEGLPGDFSVTAVIGPFFGGVSAARVAARRSRRPTRLEEGKRSSLFALMRSADMALSAAGQTLYELACTGCPTAAFQAAPNQAGQLRALERAGCLLAAEPVGEPGWLASLGAQALRLLQDAPLRRRMAQAGQALVDGLGAGRVAEAIIQELSRDA